MSVFSSRRRTEKFQSIENEEQQEFSSLDLASYRSSGQTKNRNSSSKKISSQSSHKIAYVAAGITLLACLLVYNIWLKCNYNEFVDQRKQMQVKHKKQLEMKQNEMIKLRLEKNNLEGQMGQLNSKFEQTRSQLEEAKKLKDEKGKEAGSKSVINSNSNENNPNVVINIEYKEKQYGKLPLDMLKKNSQNKGIADILYKDDDTRKKRQEFQEQRISFVDSKSGFPNLFLAKYNLILNEGQARKAIDENVNEWNRLQAKFQLSKYKDELPMCIVVPGYNNNAKFRIEYNLNSIFSQNYTNYKVVIINDASTDGGGQVYRNYLNFYSIDKSKYVYIENSKRVTALQNIYLVSINHCSKDSIVVTLDADDEFIGRNVLQVFNVGYQTKKSGVIYSNFYWFQQPSTLMYGFTSEYSDHQKKQNIYRGSPMKFSHLRSYRTQLIHQINPKDLQDDKGVFFTIAYDMALFFPLMELSCGRVNKIDGEFHYLYNVGTGLNDYQDRGRQVAVDNKVRGQKKYQCYKDFDQRMKK